MRLAQQEDLPFISAHTLVQVGARRRVLATTLRNTDCIDVHWLCSRPISPGSNLPSQHFVAILYQQLKKYFLLAPPQSDLAHDLKVALANMALKALGLKASIHSLLFNTVADMLLILFHLGGGPVVSVTQLCWQFKSVHGPVL